MAKFVFFCFFVVICLELVLAKPAAPTTVKPASQDVEDAFEALKESFSNLVQKVQEHPVVKDVGDRIEHFAIDVTNMSKQLVSKL